MGAGAEPGAGLVVEADGAVVEPRALRPGQDRRGEVRRASPCDGRSRGSTDLHRTAAGSSRRPRRRRGRLGQGGDHRLPASGGGRVAERTRREGAGSARARRWRGAPARAGRRRRRARRRRQGRRATPAHRGDPRPARRGRRGKPRATGNPRTEHEQSPCARGPDSIRCVLHVGSHSRRGDSRRRAAATVGYPVPMPLTPAERETMAGRLAGLTHPVRLALYTRADGCDTCADTQAIVEEVAALSPHLSVDTARPARRRGRAGRRAPAGDRRAARGRRRPRRSRRAAGRRAGRARADLAGRRDPDRRQRRPRDSPRTAWRASRRSSRPVHVQVFSTPTCVYCPRAVAAGAPSGASPAR